MLRLVLWAENLMKKKSAKKHLPDATHRAPVKPTGGAKTKGKMTPQDKAAVQKFYIAKGSSIAMSNHFKATPAYLKGEILALNDIVGALCKQMSLDPLQILQDASQATSTAPPAPPPAPTPPPPPPAPAPVPPPPPATNGDGGLLS